MKCTCCFKTVKSIEDKECYWCGAQLLTETQAVTMAGGYAMSPPDSDAYGIVASVVHRYARLGYVHSGFVFEDGSRFDLSKDAPFVTTG